MSQTEVLYEELRQEMILELQKQKTGVLATSEGDNVTARAMLLFSDKLTIYCFTGLKSRKYKQISTNPNVAVSAGNIQIEGMASLKGHPLDEENSRFMEIFKQQNPEYHERNLSSIRSLETSRVIEITPKRVARYTGRGQMDILNVVKKEAYKLAIGEPAYYA